ncbi:hypothetical protein BJ875DRAFT_203259 [Amylocarpus encephaloides]|uniref:Putative zinc-finger domain-containing protein n=1 Tax=Amylocarpus encephaloides TaxID=45428 RepID=A0A9P8C0E0_9HELO|nr:hypothetical protein BJ875DRAFT_203259 [Amylocarpus encephaloides]
MSNYPVAPQYGLNYGVQDQTNPPYLPPAYPTQYIQPADARMGHGNMSSSYDASVPSYGYHGPAPSFSASAIASGVPPLPIFQGWNQDAMPLPPYNAHNGQQYANYSDQNIQGAHQNSQYYAPPNQPSYQSNAQVPRPYDEGEVSEGEFEGNIHSMNQASYRGNQYSATSRTPYIEPAHQPTYNTPQAQNLQRPYQLAKNPNYLPRETTQSRQQQADAYSPCASPIIGTCFQQIKEPQKLDSYTTADSRTQTNNGLQEQTGKSQNNLITASELQNRMNSNVKPTSPDGTKHHSSFNAAPSPSNGESSASMFKSVDDARKKAQAAILNLWPYDIRYQTYIDEGFKKESLDSLFDELRIPRSETIIGDEVDQRPEDRTSEAAEYGYNALKGKMKQTLGGANSSPNTNQTNTKESGMAGSATSKSSPHIGTVATTVVMTEKERTLQSKMEALRKSREERAQKAAAKNSTKSPVDAIVPEDVTAPTQNQPPSQAQPTPSTQQPIASAPEATEENPLPTTIEVAASLSSQPAKSATSLPQGPIIPGLFLTSTTSRPASAVNPPITSATTLPMQRKRPVAADFDTPLPAATPFKRPFGHSRHEKPLVIDVSEDELDSDDEDVEMDLESQADQDSPVQSVAKLPENRSAIINNLPPLSGFRANTSNAGTPPILQSSAKANMGGRPEVLQRKESEIEQLKKKIAEAEARKKARQTPTGGQTPQGAPDDRSGGLNLASNVEASMRMQKLIGVVEDNVASNQHKLEETVAARTAEAADLKLAEDERKRLRLQKLASDLPFVDAQVQQNQSKLARLRAETARLEEEVRRSLEAKQNLAEEMERLGRETEEQLQAQREKLNNLTKEETSLHTVSLGSSSPSDSENRSELPLSHFGQSHTSRSPQTLATSQTAPQQMDTPMSSEPENALCSTNVERGREPSGFQNMAAQEVLPVVVPQDTPNTKDQTSSDCALEAALQEAVRAEADSHTHGYSDMEIETSFAPDPTQLEPVTFSKAVDEEVGSPDYSPVLERANLEVNGEDGDSDNYEPPEGIPPVNAPSPIDSPPFSPAPPEEVVETAAMDSPMQMENAQQEDVSEMPQEHPEFSSAIGSGSITEDGCQDHIVPLPHEGEQGGPQPTLNDQKLAQVKTSELFKPYETPLKKFRAFRFHPNYKQEVAGGLRSLTYSNKIDPSREFCRYELAGGVCNDTNCEFQHFKNIGLPDDAVLTTLGSPEHFNDTQREQFCEGLRAVLTDLRARKIKDFEKIAAEIIAHRAKFLGDNSKVLNLEGTVI